MEVFVASRSSRFDCVSGATECAVDCRGDDDGVVVDAKSGVGRVATRELLRLMDRSVKILEVECDQRVRESLFQGAGCLRRDGEIDPQLARRLDERRGPVRRGRQQQEETRRDYFLAEEKYGLVPEV